MSDTPEFAIPENQPPHSPDSPAEIHNAEARPAAAPRSNDRRSRRRALISAPVRVRSVDATFGGPDEVSTTLDVSRGGLLFLAGSSEFKPGLSVLATFPYSKSLVAAQAEQSGRVVRATKMPDGRYSVAVALRSGAGEDLVDSGGRRLSEEPAAEAAAPAYPAGLGSKKPLVLIVDKDLAVRDSLKSYLAVEGYDVIALASAPEAHHALNMFTPALLIAEIEGEDLPGYELCAYVKGTPRLQTVPVMLLTSSAYPSDYANAHSLGAVVCMAKPYRQERLGHVVRLLAPLPRDRKNASPARPADPSRRSCRGNGAKAAGPSPTLRFRPPWAQ